MSWIKAEIRLVKKSVELDNLGIEDDTEESAYYPFYINVDSINAIYPIPDDDGIPSDEFCRVILCGMEYTVKYNINKLLNMVLNKKE